MQNVDVAKERVRIRVANGGHGIPEADIERRYIEFREILSYCDKVELYDNTVRFIKIMTIKNGRLVYKTDPLPKWAELLLK